jgi:methionyl-tRNA formyltransferase
MTHLVLVLSDNKQLVSALLGIIKEQRLDDQYRFQFVCSPLSGSIGIENHFMTLHPLDIKASHAEVAREYDLVISLHCKQLFPVELVKAVRCINVHPGLNPYNRGWFPQVFSILNGLPLGATLHEIDEKLDHGSIIVQKKVAVEPWDTSLSAYNRVVQAEIALLETHLRDILAGEYQTHPPTEEGNVNLKKEFNALREIDLRENGSFGDFIDRLRALSHGEYKNAYFIDSASGKKIFLRLDLEKEE